MILKGLMDVLQSNVGDVQDDLVHQYHYREAQVVLQENHLIRLLEDHEQCTASRLGS